MTWEVLSAAARMIVWIILFGGIVPRVLFRHKSRDGPAQIARTAILSVLVATVLWLSKQLSLATFGVGVGAYWVGATLRARPDGVQHAIQWAWARFADVFYDERAVLQDVAYAKAPDKKQEEPKGEHASEPAPRMARLAKLHAGSGAFAKRTAAVVGVGARHVLSLAVAQRSRVLSVLWRQRHAVIAGGLAAAAGLGAVLVRLSREHPLTPQEAERLMRAAGWSTEAPSWVPDAVLAQLASALTLESMTTTSIALGAPLVFLCGISGARLFRRLAPRAPPVLGTMASIGVPAVAIASGQTAGLHLVAASLSIWAVAAIGEVARRSHRSMWIAAILAVLHPAAALVSVGFLIVVAVTERADRRVKRAFGIARTILASVLVLGLSVLAGGPVAAVWTSWLPAASPPPHELVVVAAVSSLWLVLGGVRRRPLQVTLLGRALGLVTLLTLFAAGGFDGAPKAGLLPYALEVLATVNVAVFLADLGHLSRNAWAKNTAAGASAAVALGIALVVTPAQRDEGVSRDLLELSSTLRERHLAWNFSIVASQASLPPFVDSAWVVDGRTIEEAFPAERYRFDPKRPEAMIGTRFTYIVLTGQAEEEAMLRWIEHLEAANAYPLPEPVPELSRDGLRIFLMERDPDWEREEIRKSELKVSLQSDVQPAEKSCCMPNQLSPALPLPSKPPGQKRSWWWTTTRRI